MRVLIGCFVALLACGGSSEADPIVGNWVDDQDLSNFEEIVEQGFEFPRFRCEFREDGTFTHTTTETVASRDHILEGIWAKIPDGYTLTIDGGGTLSGAIVSGTLILSSEGQEISYRRDDKQ